MQHAVVAGAGIGGLATAISLAREDINVTVFEKSAEPRTDGTGIQLGPNATRVLRALDILDTVKAVSARPALIEVTDLDTARPLAKIPLGDEAVRAFGAPYLTLHRADLHKTLHDAAKAHPAITIHHGNPVATAMDQGDTIDLTLDNGATVTADFAVAADGLWSRLRSDNRFWADSDLPLPRPCGAVAYRTLIPRYNVPDDMAAETVGLWLGQDVHAVVYPVAAGKQTNLVVIVDGEETSTDWSLAVSPDTVEDIGQRLPQKLTALWRAGQTHRKWALHEAPVARRMMAGRMALVGDAAHPVLPFLAQGGALAIEDGYTLAGVLARSSNLEDAAHRYNQLRHARVARVAAASRRNGQIYHVSGVTKFARDLVLKAAPPRLLLERFRWLYGHDATRFE